nr:response regulator [uncultured Albidiferax sp.]
MDNLAKLISALASLAWPVLLAALLYKLHVPIRTLLESALKRKFTIKVAGNELTMEEASEQQRAIVSDLQTKLAELEKRLNLDPAPVPAQMAAPLSSGKRILWVDDQPKNNSFFVATLEELGVRVDTAMSTNEGLAQFKKTPYDIVVSDMGRPEGDTAGIDLTRKIKLINPQTPVYIFCGAWAARSFRAEALAAGATEITASSSTLLSALELSDGE